MVGDFQRFKDPDCKDLSVDEDWDRLKDYYLHIMNTNINSNECQFPPGNQPVGIKVRAFCENPSTVSFNFYNQMNEDPQCFRKYLNFISSENSYQAGDGECVRMDDYYYRYTVLPNDGRSWEWKKEWEGVTFKQEVPEMDNGMKGMDGSQKFSFEGDNYSMELEMDNSNGWKQSYSVKFDKYFMYGIDYMGEDGYGMPPCGPDAKYDMCKEKVYSQETCCTHITMQDSMFMENAKSSFYRCMNVKVVDASFSFEIDGMKMSMSCSGDDKMSAASYLSGVTIIASLVALISSATL